MHLTPELRRQRLWQAALAGREAQERAFLDQIDALPRWKWWWLCIKATIWWEVRSR